MRVSDVLAATTLRPHDPSFGPVFTHGRCARLWDEQGRDFFDLTCGYSASNFGHAFEPLVAAAREQLGQLSHLTGALHEGKIALARRLVELVAPSRQWPNRVIFNATGARAIETAWKAAVAYRPGKLLTVSPGFHGRSIAAGCVSAAVQVEPRVDQAAFHTMPLGNYPDCGHCPLKLRFPECSLQCASALFAYLEKNAAQISALLVEPALGARGYVFPPAEYFRQLRQITKVSGILMIADEIQTGLGRCGSWLLSTQQQWEPDLVVLGKSLGGGITPISAVVGRADVLDALPLGGESETFAATPLACRVARQVLDELNAGPWIERGQVIGQELREWFYSRAQSLGFLSVQGQGASCVLEFLGAGVTDGQAQAAARACAQRFQAARLLVQLSGQRLTRIVILPPLTISADELTEIKQRVTAA
ncbi:MAG: aminotransferase class III-fold pyridoxal phosphate-dependent enzyme [Pirellulaceae bacterium]